MDSMNFNDKPLGIIDSKEIGKKIREQRKKKKLSREALSEKVNLSTNFLGQIERGERNFSMETMVKISQALDMSVDYLLRKTAADQDTDKFELLLLVDKLEPKKVKILLDLAKSLEENLD